MTIGWALFMWAAIIWLVPMMYFLMKNECKPKKNIILGVTLPLEAQGDGEVQAVLARFQREMKWACWGVLALILPTLLIRDFGVFLTAWIVWIVLICFVLLLPYVRCNGALRQLKEVRGWKKPGPPQAVADLRAAAMALNWLSPWWFLPPLLASLIPLFFDRELWWLWALDAALIPLFYLCYRYLYLSRTEAAGGDSDKALALTRIRRYNWGKFWLMAAWATGAFNVGLWLTLEHVWLCMAVVLAYGAAVCAGALSVELRVRHMQEKLGNSAGDYLDEDDRWLWGLLYYNPDDRRCVVNNRVGMGTTVNLAKRSMQILTGFCLLLLLSCPLWGVWTIAMERAPVELILTQTELDGSHFGKHWTVALDDIDQVERLDTLPQLFRVAGTGMDSALTGTFRNDELGRLTCCLDPRTGPWLLVRTGDGYMFLFGSGEAGGVEAVLPALEKAASGSGSAGHRPS